MKKGNEEEKKGIKIKNRNKEKRKGMDRNAKKNRNMQVFFPYAILVFQIF